MDPDGATSSVVSTAYFATTSGSWCAHPGAPTAVPPRSPATARDSAQCCDPCSEQRVRSCPRTTAGRTAIAQIHRALTSSSGSHACSRTDTHDGLVPLRTRSPRALAPYPRQRACPAAPPQTTLSPPGSLQDLTQPDPTLVHRGSGPQHRYSHGAAADLDLDRRLIGGLRRQGEGHE